MNEFENFSTQQSEKRIGLIEGGLILLIVAGYCYFKFEENPLPPVATPLPTEVNIYTGEESYVMPQTGLNPTPVVTSTVTAPNELRKE